MRRLLITSGIFILLLSGTFLFFVKQRMLYVERMTRQYRFEAQEVQDQVKALKAEKALLMRPDYVERFAEQGDIRLQTLTYETSKRPLYGEEGVMLANNDQGGEPPEGNVFSEQEGPEIWESDQGEELSQGESPGEAEDFLSQDLDETSEGNF